MPAPLMYVGCYGDIDLVANHGWPPLDALTSAAELLGSN
jgi:hypothetical protein